MTKKLILTMTLLAAVATIFVACKKDAPTYSVQVTAAQGGTVEGQNGEYNEGETVVFKAVPADGYYFIQWSDGNTDNSRTIEVGKDDITLTAEFGFVTISGDLGLKSGTIWATCNLGAANPWDYGDYYAWGETQTKDIYGWETYKYSNGNSYSFTKYNVNANYGTVDDKTVLEPTDDVATAVLGADYSMPTIADWKELADECYWVWTADYNNHGVSGYMVYGAKTDADKGAKVYEDDTPSVSYSLSDAHIFLPAAGNRFGAGLYCADTVGGYWSASLKTSLPYSARILYLDSGTVLPGVNCDRCHGWPVRPIRRP